MTERTYIAPLLWTTHRTAEDAAKSTQLTRLSNHHLFLMDTILSNPTLSLGDVAKQMGFTPAWVSTVYHSDLFQTVYQERRRILMQAHNESLSHKLNTLVDKGVSSLIDAIDDTETPLANRQQITELGLKAVGILGQKGSPVANLQVNVQTNNNNTVNTDMTDAVNAARQRVLARQALIRGTSE